MSRIAEPFSKTPLLVIIIKILLINTSTATTDDTDYPELLRQSKYISADGRLTFKELASKYGHPAEEHQVVTEDGYILTAFRLPGNPDQPVLLTHGNTLDAVSYMLRGYDSLAIVLANKGYDVWVLSHRGTIYSQGHTYLDAKTQPELYYDYSFYEIGIYDMPATIDYILVVTGQDQLVAIGFSIATTAFYVMGAERPEYNDKVNLFVSLAPICFIKHQKALGALGSAGFYLACKTSDCKAEVFGRDQKINYIMQASCLGGPLSYEVCVEGFVFGQFGIDATGFERGYQSTYFGHFPAGSSLKLFNHMSQVYFDDRFAKYDYGSVENLARYNNTVSPAFDLSKVTMNMALLVGKNDFLSVVEDVDRLASILPNVVHHQVLPYENFNHIDFVVGRHIVTTLYPYLMPLVEKYI